MSSGPIFGYDDITIDGKKATSNYHTNGTCYHSIELPNVAK